MFEPNKFGGVGKKIYPGGSGRRTLARAGNCNNEYKIIRAALAASVDLISTLTSKLATFIGTSSAHASYVSLHFSPPK